ncbi:MAG: S41 family peptidase [Pyrinomonadaceae bacterium]|nr:S41 family peptidase [Pyrinomonadaceae bacterium]
MRRSFSVGAIIFVLAMFGTVFSQKSFKPIEKTQETEFEPFQISKGKQFSASPSKNSVKVENNESANQNSISNDYKEALNVIKNNYVSGKNIDFNQLNKSSIDGMLHALDPHSNYFDANEYEELLNDQNSEYIGIGASIANYTENGTVDTFVVATYPNSPAFRAGLRYGDKILAVNGVAMTDKNSVFVREKIRGQKGTIARLTIERASTQKIETVEIRRNTVPQPSIPDAYMLRPGIGYIDFSNGFNYTTNDELEVALSDLHQQGMKSLILDMRGNPGGIVEQSVRVAEKFLQKGQIILSQKGRFEIDNRTWRANGRMTEDIPLVVLVDNGSASATEIVAGALQDYDRAIIVGENTFGKGLVQSVINLPFGSGLTLTTAKYFTPSGRSIQREYEHFGLYDYYQNKTNERYKNAKFAGKTITGRTVYGGNGILPDEVVKNPEITDEQAKLLDSMFLFVRELVNGRIESFENYKQTKSIQFGQKIRPSDFAINEQLLLAYKSFVAKNKEQNLKLEENKKFVSNRLRFLLVTSNFGSVTANQVLVENDLQVAKAVDSLPKAQSLALAAQKKTNKSQ